MLEINTEYKPAECAHRDAERDGRRNLGNVRIAPDGTATATDGHVIARIPAYATMNGDAPDGALYVPLKELSRLAKGTKREPLVLASVTLDGAGVPVQLETATHKASVATHCDPSYPDTDQVFSTIISGTEGGVEFGVDVDLLVRAAKALGSSRVRIRLAADKPTTCGMVVRPIGPDVGFNIQRSNPVVVVMPVKIEDK